MAFHDAPTPEDLPREHQGEPESGDGFVEVPELLRNVLPDTKNRFCECGTRVRWHFDGWNGNRLDCDEAQRRSGGR